MQGCLLVLQPGAPVSLREKSGVERGEFIQTRELTTYSKQIHLSCTRS